MTTLRPIVHFSCHVAAKYPHLCVHPTANESEPVQVEEDNHVATVVVRVTALACDVAGSVLNFDRSPARTWPTQWQAPKVNRSCTAPVTTLGPNVNSPCDVAAKCPRISGHPTATESEPVQVEENNHVATIVVRVTALACDVVGSVLTFDRSQRAPWLTQCRSPKVNRDCTAAVTALRPNAHSSCDVAAKYPRVGGYRAIP